MKVEFRNSFVRDLKRVRDQLLKKRIRETIELVERVDSLLEIGSARRLRGERDYYRIRLGDYRIGVVLEGDLVVFVRFLHRKDIYRYFP